MAETAGVAGPRRPMWALVAVLGAAAVGLTVSALAARRTDRSLTAHGVTTTGTVTAARQLVRVPDEVDVGFVDQAGRRQEGTAQVRRPLAVGTPVTLRYDASHPTRVVLAGEDAAQNARPARVRETIFAAIATVAFLGSLALAVATRT